MNPPEDNLCTYCGEHHWIAQVETEDPGTGYRCQEWLCEFCLRDVMPARWEELHQEWEATE